MLQILAEAAAAERITGISGILRSATILMAQSYTVDRISDFGL